MPAAEEKKERKRCNMKKSNIAIFVAAVFPDVPDGCPDDYALIDYDKRRAFAEWLQENGKRYLLEETPETALYHYKKGKFAFFVGIVPVDLSRPWMIHIYEGKERICYLDRIDENNQIRPDVQAVGGIAGFGFDSCVAGKGE